MFRIYTYRRGEALNRLPFLADLESANESLLTVPDLKNKLQALQLLHIKQLEENERIDSMLKLQYDINKELHAEIESMVHKYDKDKTDLG